MHRLPRPHGAVLLLIALALVAVPVAGGASPKAKIKLTAPQSVVAGQPASVTAAVTSKAKKALKGLKLELLLSTDAKRDAKDVAVGRTVSLGKIKAKKTVKKTARISVPAVVPAGVYRLLACVKTARKKDKPVCTSAALAISAAGAPGNPPAPAPTSTPSLPQPTATAAPDPQPTATPEPTATATPTPEPTATPTPTPTPDDTTPPAPGPKEETAKEPAQVAPVVETKEATSVADATSFLYEGEDKIQEGVEPGAIKEKRVAVLRGTVTTRVDSPIEGVRVSVADHDEYGHTATQADGGFDIAVNGGGPLTLVFEREGYIPVQRMVEVPWQDFTDVDPVVMVPFDGKETDVDPTAPDAPAYEVAKGSTVGTGEDARTATLLFEKGTEAEMELPDGTKKEVTDLDVRVTEYTQGANGIDAMPGQLPPNTAYTYAAEFSIDQAVSNGATDIQFSKPVVSYTDNFIDLPTGTAIPTGYYDREREEWVGSRNGIVIELVGETDGKADVSIDGDAEAESPGELAAIGMDDAERQRLASLYDPVKQLWRVEIGHFTPWDYNMPYGPDGDAGGPGTGGPEGGNGDGDGDGDDPGDCGQSGSLILCDSQVLGEAIPLTGSDVELVYRSDRVPGRKAESTIDIPIVEGPLPANPNFVGAELEIDVAGQQIRESFPKESLTPGQSYRFEWDGKDAYGRDLQGSQKAKIRLGYTYKAVYQAPGGQFSNAWSRLSGAPISGNRARQEYTIWQEDETSLGSFDASAPALGLWTLSIQHAYDPGSRSLLMGDGSQRDTQPSRVSVLEDFAGVGYPSYNGENPAKQAYLNAPQGVAVAPDGSVVIADTENHRVRRVDTEGNLTDIAGTGNYGAGGDGGPAKEASLAAPRGVAVAENGDVYVADTGNNRIRRIRWATKTISTVAGGGEPADDLGDGLEATEARLRGPSAVAVAPDGAIYVADTFGHRVRMIGTDGIIGTVAGTGSGAFSGDGAQAAGARLRLPQGVAVDSQGTLYVADTGNNRVRRIGVDGIIESVAGGGFPADGRGDGGAAKAARLIGPTAIAMTAEDELVIVDAGNMRVRRVNDEGIIRTLIGGAAVDPGEDGFPATATRLLDPVAVAVAPDGKMYVAERAGHRVRVAKLLMKGYAEGDVLIASEDGSEIYQFTEGGQHDRTLDALTGGVKYDFHYDADGRLTRVSDPQGDLLTVDRTDGVALVARGGARTALSIVDGLLGTVTNPAGETITLGYGEGGLLTSLEDPAGGDHAFVYDDVGRLTSDTGPGGLVKTLAREVLDDGTRITLTVADESAEDKKWVYTNRRLPTGDSERTVTDPAGATTLTLRRTDGSIETTLPDGTVSKFVTEPDPRFGMQSPIAVREERRTPGGKTRVTTRSRSATTGGTVADLQSMSETINVDGKQVYRTYDGATRTMTTNSPGGRQTTTVLDAQGRVVETTPNQAGSTHKVVTEYVDAGNGLGKVKSVTQGERSWTYGYDPRQRMVSRTDALGHEVKFAYDQADRVTEYDSPAAGGKWVYEHDLNGNVAKITMPGGQVYDPAHEDDDLLATLVLPGIGAGAYSRAYTLDRLLETRTFPSGATETSGYSAGGRLTSIATTGASPTTHGFTYVADADGTGATELADVATWSGGGSEQTIDTGYDGGLPTSVVFGGAAAGSFAYTPTDDHMVGSHSVTVGATTRTYAINRDGDRLLTREGDWHSPRVYETGAPDKYYVDGAPALTLDEEHDGYGSLVSRTIGDDYALTISRDEAGRVAGRTETVGGVAVEWKYTHDADGRLTKVERRDAGDAEFSLVDEFAYEDNGNRTNDAAQYDEQDRIEQLGGTTYQHDDDGFMTQRGDDTYEWGRKGELLKADIAGDDVTYAYDAFGRRTRRTRGADSTQYLYGNPDDIFRVTATVDEAGVLTTYLYDDEGHLRALERGGAKYAVGSDQVGSPRVVVDSTGTIVKEVEYDAWGNATDKTPAFDLPIGYAGGIADADTGLVRFGLRDYEPVSGRWTARDPSFFGGSPLNLYAYVANDPVSLRDPSGLICIGMSAYVGIGGGFQMCADGSGVGMCAEGGVGLGLGAELDATGQPGNSDTTVAELTVGVGIASATFGAEFDDCGNTTIKTTAGVAGVEIGASGGTNQPAKFEAKGGIGLPLPVSGKFAKKSCRSFSF